MCKMGNYVFRSKKKKWFSNIFLCYKYTQATDCSFHIDKKSLLRLNEFDAFWNEAYENAIIYKKARKNLAWQVYLTQEISTMTTCTLFLTQNYDRSKENSSRSGLDHSPSIRCYNMVLWKSLIPRKELSKLIDNGWSHTLSANLTKTKKKKPTMTEGRQAKDNKPSSSH